MIDGLSLVVFAYNEAESVPHVLPGILAWLRAKPFPWQLVFVDDGSTDGTLALAREVCGDDPRCVAFSSGANRGIGGALKAGVASSTQPWVTFLPCDGQIPEGELDVLLEAAHRDPVDVVFSVYRDRDDGLLRKVLSAGVRGMILAAHGVRMRSDGPYLFRRELFRPRELAPDTFFLNFEFPIRMLRRGVRHATVTIECVPRQRGVRGMILAAHGVRMRSDGPYLFRRELFRPRELAPDTFFLNFEFPIRMLRRGVRHATVTIECVPRQRGVSKSARFKVVWRVAKELVALRARL